MTGIRDVGRIQINEDMPFQKKEWRLQRWGWAIWVLILALGLMGVFGRGVVARETAGDKATFGIEFERILRHAADTHLTVHVGPGLQQDSTLRILIARNYLQEFNVNHITPEPLQSGITGEFVYFDFARPDARAPARVVFNLTPDGYFSREASIAIPNATTITFGQMVLP